MLVLIDVFNSSTAGSEPESASKPLYNLHDSSLFKINHIERKYLAEDFTDIE